MRAALALFLAACSAPVTLPDAAVVASDAGAEPVDAEPHLPDGATPAVDAAVEPEDASIPDVAVDAGEEPVLEIQFLGVGGFAIASGGDRVLTPPMYSNPPLNDVLAGTIRSDPSAIDRFLDPASIENTKAILVGHAHYDHLLDVPYLFQRTPSAFILGNVDMQRILAAFAPDRSPSCPTSSAARPLVPRDRVIAVNDPANDRVDYRLCAERQGRCEGAWDGRSGEWIHIPDSRIRVRALCSAHPDQFLIFHLGEGCVEQELCEPPPRAADWREGSTVAYLIDFLDDGGLPIFRVYYQDAPTNGPIGYAHPELIAEKEIDVALLCVGSYDQVTDQPQDTIAALAPRYVIAGHWESFFRSPDEPLANIPFLDVDEYVRRMEAALPGRSFKPDPGTTYLVRSSSR